MLRKGQTMWPAQAHLFFAGRSTAELALLQDSIINDARYACLLACCTASLQFAHLDVPVIVPTLTIQM